MRSETDAGELHIACSAVLFLFGRHGCDQTKYVILRQPNYERGRVALREGDPDAWPQSDRKPFKMRLTYSNVDEADHCEARKAWRSG